MATLTKRHKEELLAAYVEGGRKFGPVGPGFLFDYEKDRDNQIEQLRCDIGRIINLCDGQPGAITAEQVSEWMFEILAGEF